eukprot:gene3256-2238_t
MRYLIGNPTATQSLIKSTTTHLIATYHVVNNYNYHNVNSSNSYRTINAATPNHLPKSYKANKQPKYPAIAHLQATINAIVNYDSNYTSATPTHQLYENNTHTISVEPQTHTLKLTLTKRNQNHIKSTISKTSNQLPINTQTKPHQTPTYPKETTNPEPANSTPGKLENTSSLINPYINQSQRTRLNHFTATRPC